MRGALGQIGMFLIAGSAVIGSVLAWMGYGFGVALMFVFWAC